MELLLLPILLAGQAEGHGRLIEPPSRSTMWRWVESVVVFVLMMCLFGEIRIVSWMLCDMTKPKLNVVFANSVCQIWVRHGCKLQRPRVLLRRLHQTVANQWRTVWHLWGCLGWAPGRQAGQCGICGDAWDGPQVGRLVSVASVGMPGMGPR